MFHAQSLGLMKEIHDLQYKYQALKIFDMHSAQKVMMNATSFLQLHNALLLLTKSTCQS